MVSIVVDYPIGMASEIVQLKIEVKPHWHLIITNPFTDSQEHWKSETKVDVKMIRQCAARHVKTTSFREEADVDLNRRSLSSTQKGALT